MLAHHSAEDYGAAAKRAADRATEKFEAIIANGQAEAGKILSYLNTHKPEDFIVGNKAMEFEAEEIMGALVPKVNFKDTDGEKHHIGLHRNALIQALDRTGSPSPSKSVDWLLKGNTVEEAMALLNKMYSEMEDKNYLFRVVNEELRGLLSDRFRRLDTCQMIDTIVSEGVEGFGAIPTSATIQDVSFSMKLVLPYIFEPLPNEVGIFGFIFRNSDFGHGRFHAKGFFRRLWCTNDCTTEDGISEIHLGKRLSENIAFSQETYELDSKTMASALKDTLHAVLHPDNVKKRLAIVRGAAEESIDADAAFDRMQGKQLTKGEATEARKLMSSADTEMLPPGQNRWRFSNVLSLLANQSDNPDRQLELEDLAGKEAGLHVKASKAA